MQIIFFKFKSSSSSFTMHGQSKGWKGLGTVLLQITVYSTHKICNCCAIWGHNYPCLKYIDTKFKKGFEFNLKRDLTCWT